MPKNPPACVFGPPDEETKRRGLKVKPRTIEIPVEGSETPVTKSGLVLMDAGAFTVYVR